MSIYISFNSFFSKDLWFWWDELTILTSQSSHFLGLLQNHEGNFFPLGRLLFLTETFLFRGNYGLYVAVNSSLVCLIMKLLYETLRAEKQTNLISETLLMCLVGGFGLNVGVLYDSQWGLQICWFSSIGFILVGSYLCIKRNYNNILGVFLMLSWLAFGSTVLAGCLLYLCLIKMNNFLSKREFLKTLFRQIIYSFLFFITGLLIIKFFPSVDKSAMPPPIDTQITFTHFYGLAIRVVVASLVWILSPICLFQTELLKHFEVLGNYFLAHPAAATILLLIFIVMFFIFFKIKIFSNSKLPFIAMVLFSLLVALRGYGSLNSDFSIRYAPFQYIFAILFWWGIFSKLFRCNTHTKTRTFLGCIVFGTTIISLVCLPWTLKGASDANRLEFTKKQLVLAQACSHAKKIPLLPIIQPSINSEQFCNLFLKLK